MVKSKAVIIGLSVGLGISLIWAGMTQVTVAEQHQQNSGMMDTIDSQQVQLQSYQESLDKYIEAYDQLYNQHQVQIQSYQDALREYQIQLQSCQDSLDEYVEAYDQIYIQYVELQQGYNDLVIANKALVANTNNQDLMNLFMSLLTGL